MINNESTSDRVAAYLADAYLALIDNDDLDYEPHDRLLDLVDVLPEQVTTSMMLMLDMCPVHYCDLMICADDDEQECKVHWDDA